MRQVGIPGSVVAATAVIFILGCGITAPAHAQQTAALAATPELAAKGVWNDSTTYVIDDLVTSRGSTWRSKKNNNLNKVPGQTSPSTATYWELFARGFNPSGAWVNTTKYQPDDLVTHNGQTYRAKLTNTNRPPTNTTFWELLAAKGANGATGATGPQGPQGPAGPNTGIGAGSQSTPAISFNGDANTGIYSPQAGKIALVEDGGLFLHNLGDFNTGLGQFALENNTGVLNTAVGASALANNGTGGSNTALGAGALISNTTGGQNTAVGAGALSQNQSGANNVAVGDQALQNSTTADNTAVGYQALKAQTTGTANTAIGVQALGSNASGIFNTAVGFNALFSNTASSDNTALGTSALYSNTTGSSNIALGLNAGANSTTPNFSIFIGNDGLADDTTTIKIGTQGTQTTAFMAGIFGATVDVGTGVAAFVDANGQLGTTVSSRRYKHDIATMADVSAMLAKLRPVTFRYNKAQDGDQHPLQYGLIAEEVADVFPDLAVFKDGEPETVKYHLLPSFLLAGYQTQQTTIATQADEIAELKQRLAAIEALLPRTMKAVAR